MGARPSRSVSRTVARPSRLRSAVRIELPRRGHETEVALADQIHERNAAILKLLRHRDHKAHVVPGELLLSLDIALERAPRQRRLLLDGEEGDTADLLEVEVQAFTALVDRLGQLSRPGCAPTPARSLGHRHKLLLFSPAGLLVHAGKQLKINDLYTSRQSSMSSGDTTG